MMAAAQAAAAAAMREQAAQEQRQQQSNHQQQQQQQQPANDLLLQLQQHDSNAAQHLMNEMMGISNAAVPQGDNVESILEFMAQHEQQTAAAQFEPQQPIPPPPPQLPERPLKHYMTIAQDGTYNRGVRNFFYFAGLATVFSCSKLKNTICSLASNESTGTILEATKTITGFPPDALLMTSW